MLPQLSLKNHNGYCLTLEIKTRQPYNQTPCLLRTLPLHLHGTDKLEEEPSKFFNFFLANCDKRDPAKLLDVYINDFPKVEDLFQLNIFLYVFDFVGGELIGELARSSDQ